MKWIRILHRSRMYRTYN